jgi:hypothetical protein
MDAAQLITESLQETIADGFVQYDNNQTWLVIADSRDDTPETALGAEQLPALGDSKYIKGTLVWVQRRNPVRQDEPATGRKWHVNILYSNASKTGSGSSGTGGAPVSDPTQSVKEVDVTFQEMQIPATRAKLIGTFQRQAGQDVQITAPFYLQSQSTDFNSNVTNSALIPQDVSQSEFRKTISVGKYYAQWDNTWDDYLGTVNDAALTITQADASGTRFSQTYARQTLLMYDIVKQDVWLGPRLYFLVRFVMAYRKDTWKHRQNDQGTKRLIFVGQYKTDGGQYDQADLNALNIRGDYGYQDIVTQDGNGNFIASGEPVALNGWGSDQPTRRAANYDKNLPIYLLYELYPEADFNALGL